MENLNEFQPGGSSGTDEAAGHFDQNNTQCQHLTLLIDFWKNQSFHEVDQIIGNPRISSLTALVRKDE